MGRRARAIDLRRAPWRAQLTGDVGAGRDRRSLGAARQRTVRPRRAGSGAGRRRRYRLTFARPVVDKLTLRFRYRLNLASALDATTVQEVTIPSISFKEVPPGPTKVEMSLAPEIVLKETLKGWIRSSDDARAEPSGEGAIVSFTESDPGARGRPFQFKALALEPVPLPSLVVPRLLLKTVSSDDDSVRTSASYWVESHGPDFAFALPDGARWIGARVDGRIAEHVDYDPADGGYRLRFPGEVGSKSVLVELQYEQGNKGVAATWQAPRLLDGGVAPPDSLGVAASIEPGISRCPAGMVRRKSMGLEWHYVEAPPMAKHDGSE